MKCPDCGRTLREVLAVTKYGTKIKINQCFRCGGLWFDNFSLYSIPKEEIEKIENVQLDKLRENSFLGNGSGLCPKCKAKLETFRDYNLPKQLKVAYCAPCAGLWMNRGEAINFKTWQKSKMENSKIKTKEDIEFRKNIKKLLDLSADREFETFGKIGRILSTRVDPQTGAPLEEYRTHSSREREKAAQISSTAMAIIQMLLRLFLPR